MLRLNAKLCEIWGFSLLIFVRALSGNRHSSASFGLKPHHVEKFRECRLIDGRRTFGVWEKVS